MGARTIVTIDRATVVAALRVEDVLAHFQIPGQWRGRWLRSRRCAVKDHDTDAFGISREGRHHCHACDIGGDLLRLVAIGHKLDMQHDFPRVLEIAAEIAGIEDDESFGGSGQPQAVARMARDPLPPIPPLHERITLAKRRAAWTWERLIRRSDLPRSAADLYLQHERKLDPGRLRELEEIRETPMRCSAQEAMKSPDLKSLAYSFAVPGVALPVRSLDGALVDIRVRRFEPRENQPKIIGMLGGVTTGPAEPGRTRALVGCYGHPECIDPGPSLLVVVVEGALDYLTALNVWPEAQVLGAVDAGSLGLVAAHAARGLASYPGGRMLIVEQNDGAGAAADRSVNEDVNAATKVAVRILGPKRVGWLFCGSVDTRIHEDGGPAIVQTKDLNDLVRLGVDPKAKVRWWNELEQELAETARQA
jgi:hypothetical protein